MFFTLYTYSAMVTFICTILVLFSVGRTVFGVVFNTVSVCELRLVKIAYRSYTHADLN